MSRVGLVSTFRFVAFPDDEEGHAGVERCWSVLSSFLLFHLAKGVDHVFLYADADDGENRVYVGQFRVHSCQEAAELTYTCFHPECTATYLLPVKYCSVKKRVWIPFGLENDIRTTK